MHLMYITNWRLVHISGIHFKVKIATIGCACLYTVIYKKLLIHLVIFSLLAYQANKLLSWLCGVVVIVGVVGGGVGRPQKIFQPLLLRNYDFNFFTFQLLIKYTSSFTFPNINKLMCLFCFKLTLSTLMGRTVYSFYTCIYIYN